jgi:predicted GIY-YIG superfamily endonuclease
VYDHNSNKGAEYTSKRRPVELVYHESFSSKENALKREIQLKKWSKIKKQALIDSNIQKLKGLARCRSRNGSH